MVEHRPPATPSCPPSLPPCTDGSQACTDHLHKITPPVYSGILMGVPWSTTSGGHDERTITADAIAAEATLVVFGENGAPANLLGADYTVNWKGYATCGGPDLTATELRVPATIRDTGRSELLAKLQVSRGGMLQCQIKDVHMCHSFTYRLGEVPIEAGVIGTGPRP